MKKTIVLLSLLSLLASCGNKTTNGTSSTNGSEQLVEREKLNFEEEVLVKRLVEKNTVNQEELTKELIGLKSLGKVSLKKLDRFINVQCIQASGLCYITQKD